MHNWNGRLMQWIEMRWWKNKWQKVRKHTIWKGCCFFLLWLSWWLMIPGPSNLLSKRSFFQTWVTLYGGHNSPFSLAPYRVPRMWPRQKTKLGGSEVQEKREERLEERLKSSMESFDAWNQSHKFDKADRWGSLPGCYFLLLMEET